MTHSLIGVRRTLKGLGKLISNGQAIQGDLAGHWAVLADAIQTVLRREGYPKPYEALKALTRTNSIVTSESLAEFINSLDVSEEVKRMLLDLTPLNYTGFTAYPW